jgi:hypothetical protein
VDPDRILSTMTFTSNLTVEDFAAVRSVGFAPVGQVMGVAVFRLDQKYSSCGYHLTPPDHGMVRRSTQERLQWQFEQKERRWQQEYARRTPVAAGWVPVAYVQGVRRRVPRRYRLFHRPGHRRPDAAGLREHPVLAGLKHRQGSPGPTGRGSPPQRTIL